MDGRARRDELERAFLCFLPTNATIQPGLVANRVPTALTAGCQVLSAGFPLYAEFDQWIYRAPEDLADDWKRASFRFSPISVSSFAAKIAETGSAEREAGQLKTFLKEVRTRSRSSRAGDGPIALLHGFGTSPGAHAAVKRVSGLSIGSDFCAIPLEFDGVVAIDPQGRTRVSMARRVLARLASKWRSRLLEADPPRISSLNSQKARRSSDPKAYWRLHCPCSLHFMSASLNRARQSYPMHL